VYFITLLYSLTCNIIINKGKSAGFLDRVVEPVVMDILVIGTILLKPKNAIFDHH